MDRIRSLDLYQKDFPTSYGLEQGVFYQVEENFFLEVIEDYKTSEVQTSVKYLKPVWSRIRVVAGDLIVINGKDCYLLPKDEEYFIPCRPEPGKEEKTPNFSRFPTDSLKKIGKEVTRGHSMGMDDRKKFILTRIL